MPLFLGSTRVAFNLGDAIGTNVRNQSKSATPTRSTQTITPDPGYTGLSQVVVDSIPNNYIIPSGTYDISSNGVYPISSFESVSVNIPMNLQNKTVTPTSSQQTIIADSSYYGLNQVTVNAIPDSYIVPSGTYTVTSAGTANITSFSKLEVPGTTYPLVNISTYTNSDHLLISAKYSFQSSGFVGAGAQSYTTTTIPAISSITIIPGSYSQIAVQQYRYTLGSVIVDAIPNEYKIVSGTITYNSAGTYNVTNYSYVNIDLPIYNGELVR